MRCRSSVCDWRHRDGYGKRPRSAAFRGAQAGARPEIRAKGLEAPQRRNLHFTAPTVDGEGGTIEGDFAEDEPVRSSADGLTRAERRKQAKGGRRRKK
jgi:preprotein translocase subunit SecA